MHTIDVEIGKAVLQFFKNLWMMEIDLLIDPLFYIKWENLEEILGNNSRAEGFYLSSAESDVRLLEPIESLVEMYTHQENWPKLQKALLMLLSRVSSVKNKERLQEALDRLALCL